MSRGISQSDQPIERSGDGTDLFSKFDDIIALREGLLASGQEDPFSLVMEKVLSPTRAICNGRETILLGTYNYMGMTFDPDVIEAGKQALTDFGSGTTGSRVLNGTYQGHKECEDALREFEVAMRDLPEVREVHMLNGEIDFIIKIVSEDLQSFQEFLTSKLTPAPNVESVKTSLTIRTSKLEPGVPL